MRLTGQRLLVAQVIPTVGVEGEDGAKRRLTMLKHFSRLVDPSAKKAKFLSAFQKKPSSGPRDDLPATDSGSLQAATSGAQAAEEAGPVKEEAGMQTASGCLDERRQGAVKQENGAVKQQKDLSLADIKAEDVAAEDQPTKVGAAQAAASGDKGAHRKGKDAESEVDISTSDSDLKSEDLQAVKEELADCLQDSDRAGETHPMIHFKELLNLYILVSETSMTAALCLLGESTAGVLYASHGGACKFRDSRLIFGAMAAADEDSERSHLEEAVQQLISILGADTSTLEARRLLFKAGGDIERALNLYYNSTEASGEPECVHHWARAAISLMPSPDPLHPVLLAFQVTVIKIVGVGELGDESFFLLNH